MFLHKYIPDLCLFSSIINFFNSKALLYDLIGLIHFVFVSLFELLDIKFVLVALIKKNFWNIKTLKMIHSIFFSLSWIASPLKPEYFSILYFAFKLTGIDLHYFMSLL